MTDAADERPRMPGGATLNVIIPARDKARFVARSVGSIVAAAGNRPGTEVCLIENGSRDGTARIAREQFGTRLSIIESAAATAGAARNEGAARAHGRILCFLDADVVVPHDFFHRVDRLLERSPATAVGCTVSLPDDGTWIDRTWGALHARGVSGSVTLLNGACMAVPREEFLAVGGFRPELVTGEDADLCLRLIEAGGTLLESQALRTIHLDNPRTLLEFFRKEAWRGLGALATARRSRVDRPLALTVLHGALVATALVVATASGFGPGPVALALGMTQLVPLLAVTYRRALAERPPAFLPSMALYQIYFLARLWSLGLILVRR